MKAIILAAALLMVPAVSHAYTSINSCNGWGQCTGYDSNLGGFRTEETPIGETRIHTNDGNTYTCNDYGHCRGGY